MTRQEKGGKRGQRRDALRVRGERGGGRVCTERVVDTAATSWGGGGNDSAESGASHPEELSLGQQSRWVS